MDFEVISPYCGIYREENTVNVYYLQTEDLVRAYVFSNIKDAQEFCNAAKNLLEFMVNVPKGKEQLYHQEFLELTIKNKEYELIVYEAMPEEEREAGWRGQIAWGEAIKQLECSFMSNWKGVMIDKEYWFQLNESVL